MKHDLELHKGTPVVWQRIPLVGEPQRWVAPEGLTILEIVQMVPSLPPYFLEVGFVCINGENVPREYWELVRPRANGRCSVTLHVELQGGGNSTKIYSAIAAVAIVALAAVAGPEVVSLLSLTGTTALFTQAAVSAAVATGGLLLLSALAPPPTQTPVATNNPRTTSIKSAALTGNTIGAGDALARVLGYRRVFPQLICNPIVELIGIIETVEGVYGLSGPHQINTVYAGDVPLSSMQEVDYETSEGFLNSQPQGLINRQGFVFTPNSVLSNYIVDTTNSQRLRDQDSPTSDIPFYHRFQTRVAPDEFWLSLSWGEGLLNTAGNPTAIAVRARFRIKGTTTWTDLPEIHFRNRKPNQFQQTIKLMWQVAPTVPLDPDPDNGVWTLYYSVPGQTAFSPTTSGFTASSYFYAGSGDTYWRNANTATTGLRNCQPYRDRLEVYLDPNAFPQAAYEVEIVRGWVFRTSGWNQVNYTTTDPTGGAQNFDLFGYYINGGFAQCGFDQTLYKSDIAIIRATSVWNEPPVAAAAGLAVIAVKSTGRSLQQLSCDAGGYVPIAWQGVGDPTFATSTNPADHYRDVLTNINLGAFPLQSYQVDDLTQWRNDCDANGYSINCIVQGMKQMDVLGLIASAGYARPIQCETWGVAEDKDRSAILPVQIFTPRNLQSFQWTRTFAPFIDGFRVKYDDASNVFVENEVEVLDPESFSGGTRLEDIRYETIVTQADATRRALFDLKQARRRLVFYSGTADIENLVCRRGDLVGVTHDILSTEVWSSRVVSTITSAGNITGLNLDDTVPNDAFEFLNVANFFNDPTLNFFNKAARKGVCIRTTAGTMLIKEITGVIGNVAVINFVTPFADPGTIVQGCLLTFGSLGQETRRLLIQNIKPKADMVAVLTMVDEAPDLWAARITTLLLHFDGTNGQTTTVDSSLSPTTVTMTNATLSTAAGSIKFGSASCSFNGTNTQVVAAEQGNDFFSQSDFTVDFWANVGSQGATGTVCAKGTSATNNPWSLRRDTTNSNWLFYATSAAAIVSGDIANGIIVANSPVDGQLHHFAISRFGGFFFFFLDGNLTFSFYSPATLLYTQDRIMLGSDGTNFYNGNIDEFRYTNGLARWISDFNPPVVAGTP